MLNPKFKGTVKKGKVVFNNRTMFDNHISKFEDKKVFITVGLLKNDRSLNQNAYYWGVVIKLLVKETGYDKDEIHAYLADKFLGFNTTVYDKEIRIIPTTSKLKTNEFEDYLSNVRMWASKTLSVYLPLPNEVDY